MQNIDRGFAGMKKEFKKNGVLYLIVLPVIIYYFIFHYMPLYGLLMAFQDFSPRRGIMGSEWVGLTHFINFFKSPDCARIVTNTLRISLSCLLFEFPAPIIMAILINELNGKYFKRTIQTISYLPHFISLVVICGMIKTFVEADGIIGGVFSQITGNGSSMLSQSKMFLPIYVISNIWQSMGWESIICCMYFLHRSATLWRLLRIRACFGTVSDLHLIRTRRHLKTQCCLKDIQTRFLYWFLA